jgi:hypothetical protein
MAGLGQLQSACRNARGGLQNEHQGKGPQRVGAIASFAQSGRRFLRHPKCRYIADPRSGVTLLPDYSQGLQETTMRATDGPAQTRIVF